MRPSFAAGLIAAALLALSSRALAHRSLDPLPGARGHLGPLRPPYKAPANANSGTWTPLANPFPGVSFPDTAELLTDGTVIMHDGCTRDWYRLSPDNTGHYQNGTWTKTASMPAGYKPLYFATQVLPDGRMMVNGGEYNTCYRAWTNLGALYDPVADTWTNVAPPQGWHNIGDAQSVVLADGTYMLANCCSTQSALASISHKKVTWTLTGTGKFDGNDEEGWTLLPDGTVLTVDVTPTGQDDNTTEIYTPPTGAWTPGTNTVGVLADPGSYEIGPAPLLPNGLVFQIGATNHTGVYDPATGIWTAGPDLPDIDGTELDAADGPAAVLPDGNILAQLSPGVFAAPSHFVEIAVNSADDVTITQVDEPVSAPNISSFESRMVMLPTGEVFWSADVGDVEIYTPQGRAKKAWAPRIKSVAPALGVGSVNNVVRGKGFNGLTFGSYYGDDAQAATNYPIVRITNLSSGHVCYARTHDHATMGISNGGKTRTKFDVPASCETGASQIEVIANGIASEPVAVTLN